MRIEYRILWIDNAPEWVESKLDEIESYLLDFGFVLKADIKSSYKGIDFSHYDIIAVDYHLDDDEEGVDALSLIRQGDQIYTDILFYSQDGEPALRELMKTKRVDGVYCAERADAIEKMKKLILTTIQKTQEINNLRGLVMAETSEVDKLTKEILLKMKWTEDHFNERHKKLHEFHNGNVKKLEKHFPFSPEKVAPFIHANFAAQFSLWTLGKFITKEEWESIKGYEDIIGKRNVLAHGIEKSNQSGDITINMVQHDGSVVPHVFTPNDFIQLRKVIRGYRQLLEKINSR